jgi:PadR family transcriptional regulator PadR
LAPFAAEINPLIEFGFAFEIIRPTMSAIMMRKIQPLGEFEQVVLLAVLRLEGNAYGVPIRDEIAKHTGRRVSRGSVYMTLDRLENKGLLRSRMADPTPERGGRSKRLYSVTKAAVVALQHSRKALLQLWDGIEASLERT